MKSYPTLRRWLSAVATLAVFAGVLGMVTLSGRSPGDKPQADQAGTGSTHDWPLFGGSLSRNLVNTVETNVPIEWSVEEGSEKNVKWAADLGSKAYGGPVIAGGKV